jgi:hypothetical protein
MSGRKIADFVKEQKKLEKFFNCTEGGTDIPPINELEFIGSFSSNSNDNSWEGNPVKELGGDHIVGQAFNQCKSMGVFE